MKRQNLYSISEETAMDSEDEYDVIDNGIRDTTSDEESHERDELHRKSANHLSPTEKMQLVEDIKCLDSQEANSIKLDVYANNRYLFILHSVLLGISYSIVWPTLWPYMSDEFGMSDNVKSIAYGMVYIAYPIASVFSVMFVERTKSGTRTVMFTLCFLEILGNILYMLNFSPLLPLFGRFFAGCGDAFYIVLMKELRAKNSPLSNGNMTTECLASFVIGVILSPGINLITAEIPFKIGPLVVNSNNYPGLSTACLFILLLFLHLAFLKNFPEENKKFEEKKPKLSSFPNQSGVSETINLVATALFSFFYTYIVALFEIILPILLYERLQTTPRAAMLYYVTIATLYGLTLLVVMKMSFKSPLEIFLAICTLFIVTGLTGILCLQLTSGVDIYTLVSIFMVSISLPVLWASDDVVFVHLVQNHVAIKLRDDSHNMRKVVSKIAFVTAGVTVPFYYSLAVFYVVFAVLITIVLLGVCSHVITQLKVSKK